MSRSQETVIPYVEDTRNVLLLTPRPTPGATVMASLAAALKYAIQAEFQLEDMELAVESLPSEQERRLLLFYEAAEGGAGVLRRLAQEPDALAQVARRALELCHFDRDGTDHKRAPGPRGLRGRLLRLPHELRQPARPRLLDRLRFAIGCSRSPAVPSSPLAPTLSQPSIWTPCDGSLNRSSNVAGSTPSALDDTACLIVGRCSSRRPTLGRTSSTATAGCSLRRRTVHDYADVQARDAEAQTRLEDLGFYVIRFGADQPTWPAVLEANPNVFGRRS